MEMRDQRESGREGRSLAKGRCHCRRPRIAEAQRLRAGAVARAGEETVPAKGTDILLWLSGFDLSSPAILLEPGIVNNNCIPSSWPVSRYSMHISVSQILQPFLIHLP